MSLVVHAESSARSVMFATDGRASVLGGSASVERDSFYYVGDKRIGRAFGSAMPPELADLIDVSLSIYVADRLVRRNSGPADRYGLNWTRRINATIPVRDPDRWNAPQILQQLSDLLWFLTDDQWSFNFVNRGRTGAPSETQQYLFPIAPEKPVSAALFSGGLDSLAGLCRELSAHPDHSFVLLCASTNERTGAIQRRLAHELRMKLRRDIIPVVVPFGIRRLGQPYDADERTQRSRGFIFMALGAVTALMAGTDSLAIYENGIGAINLPYTAAQLGAHSTRAANPLAVEQMGQLVSSVVARSFRFTSPFLFHTKGETCTSIGALGVAGLIGLTVSCDGFPQRVHGHSQCGTCTSCILRRQALHVAALDRFDNRESYREDIVDSLARIPEDKLYPLRAMLGQVERLRRIVTSPDPWRNLASAYPQIVELVAPGARVSGEPVGEIQNDMVELYRRYCDEWAGFPSRGPQRDL